MVQTRPFKHNVGATFVESPFPSMAMKVVSVPTLQLSHVMENQFPSLERPLNRFDEEPMATLDSMDPAHALFCALLTRTPTNCS